MKLRRAFSLIVIIALLELFALSVSAAQFTGASLFSSDSSGSISPTTGYWIYAWDTSLTRASSNAYWNLWFTSGRPGGSPNGLFGSFLNGPDDSAVGIDVALIPGSYDFTIFGDLDVPPADYYGFNMFFNGNLLPDISVKAPSRTGQIIPPFSANSSSETLGFDGSGTLVPGSGRMSFTNGHEVITISEFYWATPALFSMNRVSPYSTQPSTNYDCVGSFTLRVAQAGGGQPLRLFNTGVDSNGIRVFSEASG